MGPTKNGESAPLLQHQRSTSNSSLQQTRATNTSELAFDLSSLPQQQQFGITTTGNIPAPSPYDANNNAMGYFIPSTSGASPRYPQQYQQQSPIIIHSPNQPGTMTGRLPPPQPQQPFFYPFPPPQQLNGNASAPYPYPPPPPPHIMYPSQQQQYQKQQQQQQQQQQQWPQQPYSASSSPKSSRMGVTGNKMTATTNTNSSSGLPPLDAIFAGPTGREPQPITSSQPLSSNNNGYGSTGSSPIIYNAPIQSRRLPPSGRTPQQIVLLKGEKNGQKTNHSHRRVHSDNPLRVNKAHRRANSGQALVPPLGIGAGHNRARTLSGGNPLKPRHRRGNSASSYNTNDSSMMSMRSNIAKSSFFGGIDKQGRPIMYYPYEAIRLVMVPDQEQNRRSKVNRIGTSLADASDDNTTEREKNFPFTIGHLYADGPKNMEDYYEVYHRIIDQVEQGTTPQWESLDVYPLRKKERNKEKDAMCGKQDLLPPTNYVVAVSDNIYKRMLSEVADSQSMPCGLFFCGHHEDVDYPSVWIPGILVIILFGSMIYVSYVTGFV